MKYIVTPLGPLNVSVHMDVKPEPIISERALVTYTGPGQPLRYSSPYELPPAVQTAVLQYFDDLEKIPQEDRGVHVASIAPFSVEYPAPQEATPPM